METITYKIAEDSDWELLFPFYSKAYRENHPLQNREFWNWQYGNPDYGRAIIGISGNKVVSHIGVLIFETYICSMNMFVEAEFRSGEEFINLLSMAEQFGKQHICVAVNETVTTLLRLQKWYQYANLERRIIVNPEFEGKAIDEIVKPIAVKTNHSKPDGYFWQQPTLKSMQMDDGSTAIIQDEVGGLRFVGLKNVKKAVAQAFEMGFAWCDFITSYNNPMLVKLSINKWKTEDEIAIPWLLNPVVHGAKSGITFFSKDPIDRNFYISRMHSDLGRVGSIFNSNY